EKKVYVLLNKPAGYITTADDPRDRKTVLDLIKGVSQRIYPVGRLDYASSGLLILTNDGELTYELTHPSHMVNKTYVVEVEGHPDKNELDRLEKGVMLEDGITAPAEVDNVKRKKTTTVFQLTIHEGRNRQIRRMCEKIGYPVIYLTRTKLAFLSLKNLPSGKFRYLTDREVQKLKEIT
ncbi:MAG: pseudouridine synthase, partial [Bacillota bacterium]